MNFIFKLPFSNRYVELSDYIDKNAVKELEMFFPKLVAEIFSTNSQINWGLRTLKLDSNFSLFQDVLNFLQPNGPMFRMCYKLLDCHLRYDFPYQHLPDAVRRKLEKSDETSFFKENIISKLKSPIGSIIYLNAFEFYMFHFAFHLIDPSLVLPDENNLEWDTVYLRLVELYLDHFVPCTTSVVYPLLHQSNNSLSDSQSTVGSYSSNRRSSVSIFREDVIKKISPSPPQFARTKTSSAEIWRTELVIALFLDFWLSNGNNKFANSINCMSLSVPNLWIVESSPSKEQLRCIRILLKHVHYFVNHILPEDCPINDLKREILTNNRSTIYNFFYSAMTQVPLDSSYRLLLEAWFTYLQPWRYTNPYSKNKTLKDGHRDNIDRRWFSFFAENLLMYTNLYYIVLNRLSRCDLTTCKISSMSNRLFQIFSQPLLLEYIVEVENYLEDGRLGRISSWNAIIRQNIYNLESSDFRYDSFHSQDHTLQVLEFINQIESNLPVLQLRKKQIQIKDDISFFKWLKEQFNGCVPYSSTEELKKIETYLAQSLQRLYQIHKIPENRLKPEQSYASGINESFNSVSSFDSTDGSFRSNYSLSVDPRERKKIASTSKYEGDPDLYPVRSWENKFLVSVLYFICLWLNTQYQQNLEKLYYEKSIKGGICRQILSPPQRTYYFDKQSSPEGYTRRISDKLPPRISLRRCASYYSISFFLSLYLILSFFQFSLVQVSLVLVLSCSLYYISRAFFAPIPIPIAEL